MIDDDPRDNEDEDQVEPAAGEAADPKAQRRKKVDKKLAQRESDKVWAFLLTSQAGRRELWGVLQACHTFEQIFATGPNGFPQSEATWFHIGEREVGQRIWRTLLSRDPGSVVLMHIENDPNLEEFRSAEGRMT